MQTQSRTKKKNSCHFDCLGSRFIQMTVVVIAGTSASLAKLIVVSFHFVYLKAVFEEVKDVGSDSEGWIQAWGDDSENSQNNMQARW